MKGSKEVHKTRLTCTGAAEEKRKLKGCVVKDTPIHVSGKSGRTTAHGVKDSDSPAQLMGKTLVNGRRERATLQGMKNSDIPEELLGKTLLDGTRGRAPMRGVAVKDTLSIGKGKRDRHSRMGAMDA